jgi:uncharacterized protein (DUF952 family)
MYASPSLASEGFIHCSTWSQVLPVARKFYRGQTGLVLLAIDPARVTAVLKWEPPSDGQPPEGVPYGDPFPHIYGPINTEAVVQVLDFGLDPNGEFSLPAAVTADDRPGPA